MNEGIGTLPLSREAGEGWLGPLLHAIVVGAWAGGIAGAIAGGLGGRLAMRVTALMATNNEQGSLTEADEVVGEITLDGTLGLIVFGGVLVGLIGGLLYAATSRWFADAGGWRGLAFGVYLLGALGWTVIEGDNFDFSTLGSVLVNVAMFAAIFLIFGLLVAFLYHWLYGVVPRPSVSLRGLIAMPVYALGLLLSLAAVSITLSAFGEDGREAPFYAIVPVLIVAGSLIFIALRGRAGASFDSLSSLRGHERAYPAAIAVVALPLLIGLALGAQSLAEMFGDVY